MTEQEWLQGTDPKAMMKFIRDRAGDRKLRLFACACLRRLQLAEPSRKAVELAQRYVDGMAEAEERRRVAAAAAEEVEAARRYARAAITGWWDDGGETSLEELQAAAVLVTLTESALRAADEAFSTLDSVDGYYPVFMATKTKEQEQRLLLHDIFGNPFRPVAVASAWLAWNDGVTRKLAQAIYEERAFDRLPILADALEEAGCVNAELLNHCRQPAEHVRGCWAIDLLLGKT
jgi:hypothetical protein